MRWRSGSRRGSEAPRGTVRRRARLGLTAKLLLAVIGIALLTTATMAMLAIRLIGVSLEDRVTAALREDLTLATRMITELEQTLLFHARLLAQAEQLEAEARETSRQRAVMILSLQTLRQGQMEARVLHAVPERGPERELVQKGFLGMRAAGVMMADREGEHFLAAVAPVEGPRRVDRVVLVQRRLDEEFLREIQEKTGAFVALWHHDMPVARTAEFRNLVPSNGRLRIEEMMRKAAAASRPLIATLNGPMRPARVAVAPFQVAFEPVGSIVLARPMDALVLARREMVRTIVLVMGGILTTAGGLGLLVARYLTRPLRELTDAAGQVAQGAPEVCVPLTSSSDEVGDLARAFSQMATEVAQSRQELEEWNRVLERRVAERTAELEEAQQQFIRAGKLAALGEMAAGVAHEINNPMSAVMGFAELALREVERRRGNGRGGEDMDRLAKYLQTIDRQAKRCRTIVRHLLDFARASPVSFEAVDIHRVLDETLEMVAYQLRGAQVEVVKDLDHTLSPVRGNVNQLQQVFTNLILNAQQAMPKGGTLTLRTRWTTEGMIAVDVADTGHGIPPEIRDRIFDPFFTTRQQEKGTGLGLSVSYGIVQSHGGTLTFVSEVGVGTTFTITLLAAGTSPLEQPAEEACAV